MKFFKNVLKIKLFIDFFLTIIFIVLFIFAFDKIGIIDLDNLMSDGYSSTTTSSTEFLEVAKEIWEEVCTSGQFTSYGATGNIPPTGNSIDCSGYVSWVMYEMGYSEFSYQHDTSWWLSNDCKNMAKKYGWTYIEISSGDITAQVQPGDIIVRRSTSGGVHHMNIAVQISDRQAFSV
jgi:hypothetical protein